MVGLGEVEAVRAQVAAVAERFDADLLSCADAMAAVRTFTGIKNMAAMLEALSAKRGAESGRWRQEGDRSAAHALARRSGTTIGQARDAIDTAERLSAAPGVEAKARRGALSAAQAGAIADAVSADATAERRLLALADRASLAELRDECARTKAAALPDDGARHREVHRRRSARRRSCPDGSAEIVYRSTPEEIAETWAVVEGYARQAFDRARREDRHETAEAYAADGLLAMARAAAMRSERSGRGAAAEGEGEGDIEAGSEVRAAASSGDGIDVDRPAGATGKTRVRKPTPSKVIVRVDWEALLRGFPTGDERCEIAGLGPVPVSAVRAMVDSGDAFLAAVVTKGVDVATVAHLGRQPTAHQRTALEWRDRTCVVQGCDATVRLETDHRDDWARSRITLVSLLDRLCSHHHALKTRSNWALVAGVGKRRMVPPDDPDHPDHLRHREVRARREGRVQPEHTAPNGGSERRRAPSTRVTGRRARRSRRTSDQALLGIADP